MQLKKAMRLKQEKFTHTHKLTSAKATWGRISFRNFQHVSVAYTASSVSYVGLYNFTSAFFLSHCRSKLPTSARIYISIFKKLLLKTIRNKGKERVWKKMEKKIYSFKKAIQIGWWNNWKWENNCIYSYRVKSPWIAVFASTREIAVQK